MNAHDIIQQAGAEMTDRAKTYDKPEGERSMAAAVAMFNALPGGCLLDTPERGWLFMAILKMVRSQQGEVRLDSYVDGAAYFALAGEAAGRERRVEPAPVGFDKEKWARIAMPPNVSDGISAGRERT